MKYRIEYANRKCYEYADGSRELIKKLKSLKDEVVEDIRKVYKNGVTDSVMDLYAGYIDRKG